MVDFLNKPCPVFTEFLPSNIGINYYLNRIRIIAVLLLLFFLLPHTPRFVGVEAIVPDHLFTPAGNVGYKPGQKIESCEGFA